MEESRQTVPRQIGPYTVIGKIGKGGFGTVYKVKPPKLDTVRALKVPFDHGDGLERELLEANLQVKISHPSVITVHHVELLGEGGWAIEMEYEPGGNLRDLLGHGPVPVAAAIRYTRDLADALAHAHREKILHYDIKPENILFDDRGSVKLGDFGVARLMKTLGAKMSRTMGTLSYMGPEQLKGIEDPRSEIWSLGAVFYEMLTGKVCFDGPSDSEVISRIAQGRFIPARKHAPGLSSKVDAVLNRMLEPDVDKRFQTMEAVIQALDGISAAAPGIRSRLPFRIAACLVVAAITAAAFFVGLRYGQKEGIFDIPVLYRFMKVKPVSIPIGMIQESDDARFEKALHARVAGDFSLAFRIFDEIEKTGKDDSLKEKSSYNKGLLALNIMKDFDLSVAEFRAYLKRYGDAGIYSGYVHLYLGKIYYENKKDFHAAVRHLDRAASLLGDESKRFEAKALLEKAASELAIKEGAAWRPIASLVGGLQPNNLISVILTLLNLIATIAIPIVGILARFLKPEVQSHHSVRKTMVEMWRDRPLRKVMLVVIMSQVIATVISVFKTTG